MRWTLLWLAASTIGLMAALTMLSAGYADGEFLPSNADAFYHARRILDSVMTGSPVIQFDDRIHVPEGSWLTWPWGFDTLLASITRLFGPFATEASARRILMNIPPAAVPIAMGLAVLIARQLALPFVLASVFVLGFAALPLAYMQFAVGDVDHHFAELLCTLGSLSAGIWFFGGRARSVAPGVVLGLVLGGAMAIHNGLFILQIPVAIMIASSWLRGAPLPERRQMWAFALTLTLTTIAVCIPSQPWRNGFFEFYTLSWFHFYIATCVAVFALILSYLRASARNVAIVIVAALAAMVPIGGTFVLASRFVSGELESIRNILEASSPYALYWEYGEIMSTRYVSWLLWLAGPMLLLNLWWAVRQRDRSLQFVAIVGVLGLVLMQAQFRFSVYGEASMLLTPVLAAQQWAANRPDRRKWIYSGCVLLFVACFLPTFANWQMRQLLGGDPAYGNIRATFPVLDRACRARPGIVLGDLDTGHWVRFHSQCSVIGDVFLLTPQHAEKALLTQKLLRLTPAQLLADDHQVRYVLPHHSIMMIAGADGRETPDLEELRQQLGPLERELLAQKPALPPQYHKLWEVRTPAGQIYSRLYEIERAP
jgi:hypothetical protein